MAAAVSPGLEPPESPLGVGTALLVLLTGLAVLFFAAAAISPTTVPWPRVAAGLDAHRLDFTLVAFAALGVALVMYCVLLIGL